MGNPTVLKMDKQTRRIHYLQGHRKNQIGETMSEDYGRLALDRLEIEEAARRYGRGVDGRNPGDDRNFDLCLTEDVEIVYPFGTWHGIASFKRAHKVTVLDVFTFTQHVLTNSLIDLDGDRASAEYYVFAAHGLAGKVIYAGALYRHKLRRLPQGWRITRHECITNWIDDAGGLMQAVVGSLPKS